MSPLDVTELLFQWNEGNLEARAALMRVARSELRRLAEPMLRSERCDHTLQPTALFHEAYLKLVAQRQVRWRDRGHFFAFTSGLMRRILVDSARRRCAVRRGSEAPRVRLTDGALDVAAESRDMTMLAVERVLEELATFDSDLARLVELRFFGGLTVHQTAAAVGVSRATVMRDWAIARAWLHHRLAEFRM